MTTGSWYRLNLGDAMLADSEIQALKLDFETGWKAAGRQAGMAVYLRHESEGRLHCDLIAWFTPAAREIAVSLGARAYNAPSMESLSLLAGAVGS